MNEITASVVRRAILDLLNDIGGEHSHAELASLLNEMGHRVARRDIAEQLLWLRARDLVAADELEKFTVARILSDGRDVADGQMQVYGVSKFKTGE
jgi:hypothetical protein